MSSTSSRREILRRGATIAAATIVAPITMAETTETNQAGVNPKPTEALLTEKLVDAELTLLQTQLSAPLDEQATKLTRQALLDAKGATQSRLKFRLPENSEPSFEFSVWAQVKGGRGSGGQLK